MARTTYVYRNGKMVEKQEALFLDAVKGQAPGYISDNMDALWHPADNSFTDSKSQFRRLTKKHGCVEVGNDISTKQTKTWIKPDKRQRVEDIKRAIYELKNGRQN
jgi:hypothetical protein